MDLKLPETLHLESKTIERMVLARGLGDQREFVTIDFEFRRWQLGNHPYRILNPIQQQYQARGWRERLIKDAAKALLSRPVAEAPEDVTRVASVIADAAEPQLPLGLEATAEPKETPIHAYAWKVLANGQISQAASAATPEALFQLAGFRPHQVHDQIQGFLAVQVQWGDGRWKEIPASS